MVPSEVCEDIPDQADCFAPTRNIARRSCRTVPSTLQKEVCRSRPSPCPDVCREEEVTRCHPAPGCSSNGQRCIKKTKRVCRQVPHPICALVRNTRRARQLRFDDARESDYSDIYAEKSDSKDEDMIVHQLDERLTGDSLVDQENRFFNARKGFFWLCCLIIRCHIENKFVLPKGAIKRQYNYQKVSYRGGLVKYKYLSCWNY